VRASRAKPAPERIGQQVEVLKTDVVGKGATS
jgi:hypothetical protein